MRNKFDHVKIAATMRDVLEAVPEPERRQAILEGYVRGIYLSGHSDGWLGAMLQRKEGILDV